MSSDTDSRPVWNQALADSVVGKVVLVGLTYSSDDGSVKEQEQFCGTVLSAHPRAGIVLSLAGQRDGKLYTLPPDTRSIEVAPPGEYRLRATGEVVCNPDYTVTFSISRPA
jgi:hypothetical protein